jgi:hypothetical protein
MSKEHELENKYTRRFFDLEEIIEFQQAHCIEVARGADLIFDCYIDKKCYANCLTPMGALVEGIREYKRLSK